MSVGLKLHFEPVGGRVRYPTAQAEGRSLLFCPLQSNPRHDTFRHVQSWLLSTSESSGTAPHRRCLDQSALRAMRYADRAASAALVQVRIGRERS